MQEHRKIVVTGCSRGLGRALVERFIASGHQVAGFSRSGGEMRSMANQYGSPHDFQAVDISQTDQIKTWSEDLLATFGIPDVLVNNAAIINTCQPLWQESPADFARLTAINLNGMQAVIHYLLPTMLSQSSGIVVNISSGWGRSVAPDVAPYCASKWAVEGMTKALAEELPAGFAAVPLSPGIIDTDMLRGAWGDAAGAFRSPSEWAVKAAPYILALESHHNGQSLTTPE